MSKPTPLTKTTSSCAQSRHRPISLTKTTSSCCAQSRHQPTPLTKITSSCCAQSQHLGYINLILLLSLVAISLLMLGWQNTSWQWQPPSSERWVYAVGALIAWLALVTWQTFKKQQQNRKADTLGANADWLVAYASQTGFAEQLAQQSAAQLRAANRQVDVLSFQQLTPKKLAHYQQALLLVSTTGEGDAPDEAIGWVLNQTNDEVDLSGLRFGLLALGDSNYQQFCAFGRRLDSWLQDGGAQPLFERIEVDNSNSQALASWQQQLKNITQLNGEPASMGESLVYQTWQLAERIQLHEEEDAGTCFYFTFTSDNKSALNWQAGDIVRIALPSPSNANGELDYSNYREYSISSLPSDGCLQLFIRQRHSVQGQLGAGSAYLTQQLAEGDNVQLAVRTNSRFHIPKDNRPLILIGNGTGIAGLRALLKARIAQGYYQNWLVFGRRCAAQNGYYLDDINAWHKQGFITLRDEVFSRECNQCEYVQHRLYKVADELREWVARGAAIYVCGSRQGMASDVDKALAEILGAQAMEGLRQQGLYRRDVY